MRKNHARSSRSRYRDFVEDYRRRRLDDPDAPPPPDRPRQPPPAGPQRAARRQYIREYLRWLWPHRVVVAILFVLAAGYAGLRMVEPQTASHTQDVEEAFR